MGTVFVSGCYDLLHAGHIDFWRCARELGDELIVCVADDETIQAAKGRLPALPFHHRVYLIASNQFVDNIAVGTGRIAALNFEPEFRRWRPEILATTEDDKYENAKRALCEDVGSQYVQLPKTLPFEPISSTDIRRRVNAPSRVPVRVDFAGGWLDVPKLAREDGYIVNCAVTPCVSLTDWQYEQCGGLGGSGAWAVLNGHNGVDAELDMGVGWQDPAIVREGGLCVWRSGDRPMLDSKHNTDFLRGRMAIYWTGTQHDTPGMVDKPRPYGKIAYASQLARLAAQKQSLQMVADAIATSYSAQLEEAMAPLPLYDGALACKYLGGGHGGYALYLFGTQAERDRFVGEWENTTAIEPWEQWADGDDV